MYIENIKINGLASLAPMAGVTDMAFRDICCILGASYTTSEMVSVKGLIYNDKKTLELIKKTNNNTPFAVQLFGNSPDDFAKATEIILAFKPDIIDINMGCPASKIIKSGSGSALMINPKLCGKIVEATKKISTIPVTVKIRSGFDENNITALEVAKSCEYYGASAITVHGRTAKQAYSGNVNLDIIKSVSSIVKIPVIGNGDISSLEDVEKMISYTGCSMVTIGRGALGNPWIFKEINFNPHKMLNPFYATIQEKINVIKNHLNKSIYLKGESRAIKEFRKHFAWYLKGTKSAKSLRKNIFSMNTYSEFEKLCSELLNNYL